MSVRKEACLNSQPQPLQSLEIDCSYFRFCTRIFDPVCARNRKGEFELYSNVCHFHHVYCKVDRIQSSKFKLFKVSLDLQFILIIDYTYLKDGNCPNSPLEPQTAVDCLIIR